jgi:hypothetical protein
MGRTDEFGADGQSEQVYGRGQVRTVNEGMPAQEERGV